MKILGFFLVILTLNSFALNKMLKTGNSIKSANFKTNSANSNQNKNGQNILHSIAGFRSPQYIETLTANGGPVSQAEEISTKKVFYDGSQNLSTTTVNCNLLSTVPNDCVQNKSCGWCGDKSKCIPGTARGPLSPCLKKTFVFNRNDGNWNPFKAGTININANGQHQEVHLTSTPDIGRVVVDKPYN